MSSEPGSGYSLEDNRKLLRDTINYAYNNGWHGIVHDPLAEFEQQLVAALCSSFVPVAWRWRNRGGEWWYSEVAPAAGQGYVGKNAEIEPLYGSIPSSPSV